MSLSSVVVIGTGSRGVLVNNLKIRNRKPVWATNPMPENVIYKISTGFESHDVEIENAKILYRIDSHQKYFVFPVATYSLTGDPKLLRYVDGYNKVPNKQFDVNAKNMYIDAIPYGGKSLKKLKEERATFTPQQAKRTIRFLLQGLVKLHQAGISHGDVHPHNVLIHMYQNGNLLARWIDFGEMHQTNEHQRDMKQFGRVIQMIISMVNGEDADLNTIYSKISRGVAHMNAMGLLFDISGHLATPIAIATKRKRSTSSLSSSPKTKSKSKSGDGVKKALFF